MIRGYLHWLKGAISKVAISKISCLKILSKWRGIFLSVILIGVSNFVLAEEVPVVADDETQLAKRMAERDVAQELPFEFMISTSLREDSFDWSVSNEDVDPFSEVNWRNTEISQVELSGKVMLGSRWYLDGNYARGTIGSGENQDSDFAESGRAQEYSRSTSQTAGTVDDFALGLGVKLIKKHFSEYGRFFLSPSVGWSQHRQNLIMFDAQRVIPFEAPINDLRNNYDVKWKGGWVALESFLRVNKRFSVQFLAQYHSLDYKAVANWNLRQDLEHPESFRHDANGRGATLNLGLSYYCYSNLSLSLNVSRREWTTWGGVDTTYFSSGVKEFNSLNPIDYSSEKVTLGLRYEF